MNATETVALDIAVVNLSLRRLKVYTVNYVCSKVYMVLQYRKIMAMTFVVTVQVMVELYAYLMCVPPIGFVPVSLCDLCRPHGHRL